MPTFKIQHITTFEYDRLIQESLNEIKIFPIISSDQEILKQDLTITGNTFDAVGLNTQVFFYGAPKCENLVVTNNCWPKATSMPVINNSRYPSLPTRSSV